jgi:glycosyltransferase involved in cell wall biosynthesis
LLFIYQEAALMGPALLERLAGRAETPMVYDLDDPRFLPYRSPANGWASLLKFPGKTRSLLRLADHVIVINRLLKDYADRYNPAVTVIPNFVDLDRYQPVEPPPGPARLAWIGSQSTMGNLQTIGPALVRLQADGGTPLRVIAAAPAVIPDVRTEFRPWSAATEVADLQACHVGLLPIADTPWNRLKFFFKAVQYMALGLPVVARRMGSNGEIIDDGVNGFLVESQEEWYHRLRALVDQPELRRQMGAAARRTAVEHFSLPVQLARVAATFDQAAANGRRR